MSQADGINYVVFFFVRSLYCLVPNNKSKLCWELLIYVDCRYSKKFDDDF